MIRSIFSTCLGAVKSQHHNRNPHKENVPVFESIEHKPDSEGEYERIKNAGHYVTPARHYSNGISPARVSGSLALSRAFGDFYLKTWIDQRRTANAVSAEPDIQIIPVSLAKH